MKSLFTDFTIKKEEKIKIGMFIGLGLFFIFSSLHVAHGDLLVALICGVLASISISFAMVYKLFVSVKHLKDDNNLK